MTTNTKTNKIKVYDGDDLLFVGHLKTHEDYIDEVVKENNECAKLFEIFSTKDKQYYYWQDLETNEDFITEVKNE